MIYSTQTLIYHYFSFVRKKLESHTVVLHTIKKKNEGQVRQIKTSVQEHESGDP